MRKAQIKTTMRYYNIYLLGWLQLRLTTLIVGEDKKPTNGVNAKVQLYFGKVWQLL